MEDKDEEEEEMLKMAIAMSLEEEPGMDLQKMKTMQSRLILSQLFFR